MRNAAPDPTPKRTCCMMGTTRHVDELFTCKLDFTHRVRSLHPIIRSAVSDRRKEHIRPHVSIAVDKASVQERANTDVTAPNHMAICSQQQCKSAFRRDSH
jgi:hypothetical protein